VTIKFSFVDVTWQQTFKHIKKSIFGANVRIYLSQFSVLDSEEETKGMF